MWRERARAALPVMLIVVPVVALFLGLATVYSLDPYQPGDLVRGTLVRLHQVQSEVPQPPDFVVELDSGAVVAVGGRQDQVFRKGARVLLREYVSRVFGRRSYGFVRYLEDDAG